MATLAALHSNAMIPADAAFIGGTALRLCHGSPRMSVDLDFHRPPGSEETNLDRDRLATAVEAIVGARVDVSTPSGRGSRLARVSAALPERTRDIKRPMTMIDMGKGVVMDAKRTIVFLRMAGSPPGASDITSPFAIHASSLEEIFADKHIALAERQRIKHRDLFDILWLGSRGICFNSDMLIAKMDGDQHKVNRVCQLLDHKADEGKQTIMNGDYTKEMALFLPSGSDWLFENGRNRTDMADAFATLVGNSTTQVRHALLKSSHERPVALPPKIRGGRSGR